VPFLDHRVIEFANKLPPNFKLRGLREKAVLRESVRDLLPDQIVNRVKQPYRSPDIKSFTSGGAGADLAAQLLGTDQLRDAGYFDPQAVQKLVEKCRSGRAIGFADNMAFVGILSTMVLHEVFINERLASAA
jgi:asparagine synthase (glutamine-hydrolysing)